MVLEAVVKDDGTLIAKAPDSLRGKRVKIIVRQPEHQPPPPEKPSQWDEISAILDDARSLDIPRRSSEDILQELHTFRESV